MFEDKISEFLRNLNMVNELKLLDRVSYRKVYEIQDNRIPEHINN